MYDHKTQVWGVFTHAQKYSVWLCSEQIPSRIAYINRSTII